MSRGLFILILVIILIAAGGAFWYYYSTNVPQIEAPADTTGTSGGFSPFDRNPIGQNNNVPNQTPISGSATTTASVIESIPELRLLSNTPVAGYGILTQKGTSTIRWVDRGRGNVYEVTNKSPETKTLSNTILPRVYLSLWNKNLSAFIGSLLNDKSESIETVSAELEPQAVKQSTSSDSQLPVTPFTLHGQNLPDHIVATAVSPKRDRIFFLVEDDGRGVGYVSGFSGQNMTKIFDTPVTQVNVEWPEENTIAITTKGISSEAGFLYFVSPKTGIWKKVFGPTAGLSTRVSNDAKRIFVSEAAPNGLIKTEILNLATKSTSEAVVRTLADKCVWAHVRTEVLYCAVPTNLVAGAYPEDWYLGRTAFVDKLWSINAQTGEIHLISEILDQSKRLIDISNLSLDNSDQYLVFINKNDLSLWSLDLLKH